MKWGLKRAALACALVVCICFLAAGCKSGHPGTQADASNDSGNKEPVRLRILSYNIHHAEGVDGKLDVERIARVIREANPDLVAIQEVDDRTKRTHGVNEEAEFARLTGMQGAFAQAMPYQGGGYGQAVLSRWPIKSRTIYNLPQKIDREPRIAAAIRTRAGENGPEIVFASTHLDHQLEEVRLDQARALNSLLSTNLVPVILAGDFNAVPESGTISVLTNNWIDAAAGDPHPTIPSKAPKRRIDYILLGKGSRWKVLHTEVLNEPAASDHRPVLAVVELENNSSAQ